MSITECQPSSTVQQQLSSGNGKASEDSLGEINDVCRTAEPVLVGNVSPLLGCVLTTDGDFRIRRPF